MERLRRQIRIPLNAKVRLLWMTESGEPCYSVGKAVNISEQGLRLECNSAVPVRGYINFEVENSNIQGTGSVRSCIHEGSRYVIGLEFSGGLKWTPDPNAGGKPARWT